MPSEVWMPTAVQILEADQRVRAALTRSLSTAKNSTSDDYYIQYFGFLINNQQVIFANGVHEVAADEYLPTRWHSTPMVICDLGRAGFRAEYNVRSKSLGDIRFSEEYLSTP